MNSSAQDSAVSGKSWQPLAALILGIVGIAFAPILGKLAVDVDGVVGGSGLSPSAVAFWRMLFAVPIFAVLWARATPARERSVIRASARQHWALLLLPGLLFALDLGPWHWSFEYTSVANATLLANFAVIVVTIVAWIWFGERPRPLFFVGAGVALLGMAALVGKGVEIRREALFGDLLATFCAIAYAGYLLSTKRLMRRFSAGLVMLASTSGCALFLFIGSLLAPGRMIPATLEAWACVIGLALVAQVFGQGLIAWAMQSIPVTLASVTLIGQPVLAAGLGVVILGQDLGTGQIIAGVVSVAGIWLARLGSMGDSTRSTQITRRDKVFHKGNSEIDPIAPKDGR